MYLIEIELVEIKSWFSILIDRAFNYPGIFYPKNSV